MQWKCFLLLEKGLKCLWCVYSCCCGGCGCGCLLAAWISICIFFALLCFAFFFFISLVRLVFFSLSLSIFFCNCCFCFDRLLFVFVLFRFYLREIDGNDVLWIQWRSTLLTPTKWYGAWSISTFLNQWLVIFTSWSRMDRCPTMLAIVLFTKWKKENWLAFGLVLSVEKGNFPVSNGK